MSSLGIVIVNIYCIVGVMFVVIGGGIDFGLLLSFLIVLLFDVKKKLFLFGYSVKGGNGDKGNVLGFGILLYK